MRRLLLVALHSLALRSNNFNLLPTRGALLLQRVSIVSLRLSASVS